MSQLSVWLRGHGLGGVADAFKGVEDSVVTAVVKTPAVQNLETQTVQEVGTAIQNAALGAIAKANPEAEVIAKEVSDPLVTAVEALVLHFLQSTTTAVTKP